MNYLKIIFLLSAILISGCIKSKLIWPQNHFNDQFKDALLDYEKSGLEKYISENPNSEISDKFRYRLNELNNKDYLGNDILFDPKMNLLFNMLY